MGNDLFRDKRFLVLTGNYGSGKTEIALHLAETFAKKEKTKAKVEAKRAKVEAKTGKDKEDE